VWTIGLFTFAGICSGVLAYAMYDGVINHVDHNLFPFEIAIDAIFAMPGLISGLVLARSIDHKPSALSPYSP